MTEETISLRALAKMIDHSLLHPTMTDEVLRTGCELALEYGVATACIKPYAVPLARDLLAGSDVAVCAVIGFPHGNSMPRIKFAETLHVIADGATEVDMVINIGALKSGDLNAVERDIAAVVEAGRRGGAIVKVIIEAALLTDEQKVRACRLSMEAGAHFVKTSTGFGPGGATVHDVDLMRRTVGEGTGVKAAGGIRTFRDLTNMLAAGATRIGASASVKIIGEATSALGGSR